MTKVKKQLTHMGVMGQLFFKHESFKFYKA